MPITAILMRDNTFDSTHRHLGFGTIHLVPEEVSAEDAEILIEAGKAEAHQPTAVTDQLTVVQIRAELDALKVTYKSSDKKDDLLQLLQAATGREG